MNKKTKKIVIVVSIVAICLFLWNFSSNEPVCNKCYELKRIAEPHVPEQSIHKPHFPIERMHYRARVPKFQKECEDFLYGDEIVSGKSQVGQDAFLFWNFFANSISGTYIDIGSNHYEILSNTWVFDNCLHWKGYCIEPNSEYADVYPLSRSCSYQNICIWKENGLMNFDAFGVVGKVSSTGKNIVQCKRLETFLDDEEILNVDFISLDIEGAELEVLRSFPFHKYNIRFFLIETFWIDQLTLDEIMNDAGYAKIANLAHDDLYEKMKNPPRYNAPGIVESRKDHHSFRLAMRNESKVVC